MIFYIFHYHDCKKLDKAPQHSTAQHSTAQHNTTQHNAIKFDSKFLLNMYLYPINYLPTKALTAHSSLNFISFREQLSLYFQWSHVSTS